MMVETEVTYSFLDLRSGSYLHFLKTTLSTQSQNIVLVRQAGLCMLAVHVHHRLFFVLIWLTFCHLY